MRDDDQTFDDETTADDAAPDAAYEVEVEDVEFDAFGEFADTAEPAVTSMTASDAPAALGAPAASDAPVATDANVLPTDDVPLEAAVASAEPDPERDAPSARPYATPFSGLTSLRFRGVPLLTLGLLCFAVSLIVGNYLPTRASTAATVQQLDAQRRENRESAERIRRAEAEAARLEHDPWLTERILRDQLHMTRPGEVIIR